MITWSRDDESGAVYIENDHHHPGDNPIKTIEVAPHSLLVDVSYQADDLSVSLVGVEVLERATAKEIFLLGSLLKELGVPKGTRETVTKMVAVAPWANER